MTSEYNSVNMILFGAGSSVPFDIPGMKGFTDQFIATYGESELVTSIKEAIDKSSETIGIHFTFDLEALLSVLNDLSGVAKDKPISAPTACLLILQNANIKTAREKYGGEASSTLNKLKEFIFMKCMQPINKGKQEGHYRFLNRFYGPLMTILNAQLPEATVAEPLRRIYSTNWDLCFKQWVDYVNIPMYDWTDVDKQSSHVLSLSRENKPEVGFIYTPLHGSLDLVKLRRLKGEASYEEIRKIPDPVRYFEGKPDNIKDIFMIYPLEAVGYEESIKSPYLDLLNDFRSSLRRDSVVFIIGYSLRDPIIGSIFEEVIAERIRKGDLSPLSEDIEARMTGTTEQRFKIFVVNPEPQELAENLRKQSNNNLLQTFIPLKLEFPKIDERFDENFKKTLFDLIVNLVNHRYLSADGAKILVDKVNSKYGTGLSANFPWTGSFVR